VRSEVRPTTSKSRTPRTRLRRTSAIPIATCYSRTTTSRLSPRSSRSRIRLARNRPTWLATLACISRACRISSTRLSRTPRTSLGRLRHSRVPTRCRANSWASTPIWLACNSNTSKAFTIKLRITGTTRHTDMTSSVLRTWDRRSIRYRVLIREQARRASTHSTSHRRQVVRWPAALAARQPVVQLVPLLRAALLVRLLRVGARLSVLALVCLVITFEVGHGISNHH